MPYEDFVDHFWNLGSHLLARSDLTDAEIAKAIAKQANLEGFQAGKTKASGWRSLARAILLSLIQ